MSHAHRIGSKVVFATLVAALMVTMPHAQGVKSAMSNPYRMIERWPTLGPNMKWGAAIGLIPDGQGGVWMHFRSEPAINHFDASGKLLKDRETEEYKAAVGYMRDLFQAGVYWPDSLSSSNSLPLWPTSDVAQRRAAGRQ